MAFSNTLVDTTVFGNKRVQTYDVTADAASGAVVTGLSVITYFQVSAISMATNSLVKYRPNISAASAAANGQVMVSACASGDRFFITVYGH